MYGAEYQLIISNCVISKHRSTQLQNRRPKLSAMTLKGISL